MINLKEKTMILKKYFIEGYSMRKINRETSIARKTISKYVREFESYLNDLDNAIYEKDILSIIEKMVEKPKYNSNRRSTIKLTDEVKSFIDLCIKENEKKKTKRMHKQLMKKIDIYELLIDKGYDIGYTTVCNYIRKNHENKAKEAFIRQEYKPGENLQFDYGDVKLIIKNKLIRVNMALFTTSYGSCHFAELYENKKMTSFLDAHVKAFEAFGGVHLEVLYDNLKQAVRKFVGRYEKEATEDLIKMSTYYGFNYRFCNAYRGNEKGKVERGVEYVRRKVFSKKDTFDSLEDARKYLQKELKKLNNRPKKIHNGKTPFEMLEEEMPYLKTLQPKYEVAQTKNCRVNKYSFITIEQNNYSVPDYLVGKFIFSKIYPTFIEIYYNNQLVAKHERLYKIHETNIKIEHYLSTLKKKPGALKNSLAYEQMAPGLKKIYKIYYNYSTTKTKKFIELLELIGETSFEKVEQAIEKLAENKIEMVTTDNIKLLVKRNKIYKAKQEDKIQENSLSLLKDLDALFNLKNAKAEVN